MRPLLGLLGVCTLACGGGKSLANVSCQMDDLLGGAACECATTGTPTSFECSESSVPHTTCCADATWPLTGSCVCLPNVPTCIASTAGPSCQCFVGNFLTGADQVVLRCTAQGSGRCCAANDDIGTCHCNIDCAASEGPVTSCAGAPVTICPQGSQHVSSCAAAP